MKTSSAAKKRFVKKDTRVFKANKAYKRHLLTKKSQKRKRQMRTPLYVHSANINALVCLLPN